MGVDNDLLCSFLYARFRAILQSLQKQAANLQLQILTKDLYARNCSDSDIVKMEEQATFGEKFTENNLTCELLLKAGQKI